MPIQLDTTGSLRPPSAKLDAVGKKIAVAIYDIATEDDFDMDGNPKFHKSGDPQKRIVVSGIVVAGDANRKENEELRPVAAGDDVSIWLASYGKVKDFKKSVPANLSIGMVLSITRAADAEGKFGGMHVYEYKWAECQDADLVKLCNELSSEIEANQEPEMANAAAAPAASVAPAEGESYF